MKDELLVYTYSDTGLVLLLPKRVGIAKDVFLPLKEVYFNSLLQSNKYIFSSHFGGYYHVKLKLDFTINTLVDLASTTIALLINSYIDSVYQGNLGRIELILDSSGIVSNTQELSKTYDFEIYLKSGSHFDIAFTHEVFKSIVVTVTSIEINIYEISDRKTTIPDTLVSQDQLQNSLQNFMRSSDYVNSDGTVGIMPPVAFSDLVTTPAGFPPSPHTHSELLSEEEFIKFKNKIIEYIRKTNPVLHSHSNLDLLQGFYMDGQLLYFKGKRFMTYGDYLDLSFLEDLLCTTHDLSDLHYDVLNLPPEEYFYDKGNNLRWEATEAQYLPPNVWSTLVFNAVEVIQGDLVVKVDRTLTVDGEWKFYPQVPGVYNVNFFYLFDYQTVGGVTGDRSDVRYGLFRNNILYSILDYKWLTLTELLSGFHHLRDSSQGTDKIVLKLGDFINIKVFHNYGLPIGVPALTKSYGYIDIERVDTESREISPTSIPAYLQ